LPTFLKNVRKIKETFKTFKNVTKKNIKKRLFTPMPRTCVAMTDAGGGGGGAV